MRHRTEKAILQVLAKAVVDGQRDDERGDSGGNSNDGDEGDDPDDGLPPLGPQVSRSYEEFELHRRAIVDAAGDEATTMQLREQSPSPCRYRRSRAAGWPSL